MYCVTDGKNKQETTTVCACTCILTVKWGIVKQGKPHACNLFVRVTPCHGTLVI